MARGTVIKLEWHFDLCRWMVAKESEQHLPQSLEAELVVYAIRTKTKVIADKEVKGVSMKCSN